MSKLHPLRTGALYGLIAGILNVVLAYINLKVLPSQNGLLSTVYNIVLPVVAIYLASHLTGRQERMNLGTTITSGTQATLFGTSAGIGTGVVYVLSGALLTWAAQKFSLFQPTDTPTNGFGGVIGTFQTIGGVIVWLVFGALAGTVGGFFGDSRAHKQLKNGAVQTAAGAGTQAAAKK